MYNAADVERLRQEVEKAQRDLAEVVDECVFAEQQSKKLEQALKAASSQCTMDKELLECIDVMILYINTIEHQVLLPSASSISSVIANTLSDSRDDVNRRLEVIGALVAADTPYSLRRALALSHPPSTVVSQAVLKRHEILDSGSPVSLEDSYVALFTMMSSTHQLKSYVQECISKLHGDARLMNGESRDAASTAALNALKQSNQLLEEVLMLQPDGQPQRLMIQRIQELEESVAAHESERMEVAQRFQVLQRALTSAKAAEADRQHQEAQEEDFALLKIQNQHQSETIRTQQDELIALGRELRDTKREYEEQIEALKRQLSETLRYQGSNEIDEFMRKVDGSNSSELGHPVPRGDVQAYQTKLKAFEMTITALNSELAGLEDKIIALERKSDDEAAEAARQIAEIKRHHREELDQCDVVVDRLTTELEGLIRENMALKQRLKIASR